MFVIAGLVGGPCGSPRSPRATKRVGETKLILLGLVVAVAGIGYGSIVAGGAVLMAPTLMKISFVLVLGGVACSVLSYFGRPRRAPLCWRPVMKRRLDSFAIALIVLVIAVFVYFVAFPLDAAAVVAPIEQVLKVTYAISPWFDLLVGFTIVAWTIVSVWGEIAAALIRWRGGAILGQPGAGTRLAVARYHAMVDR